MLRGFAAQHDKIMEVIALVEAGRKGEKQELTADDKPVSSAASDIQL